MVWVAVHGEWIGRMDSTAMLGAYSVLVQVLTGVCGLVLVLGVELPFMRIRKHLGV